MTKYIKKPPSGFQYYADFLTPVEEKQLLKQIKKLDWQQIKMHGMIAKRRVVHFGLDYAYEKRSVHPTNPIPKFLQVVIKNASQLLKINKVEIVEVLITEYQAGAGIGWHRDAKIFGNQIFGISLLSPCVIKLRLQMTNGFQIYKKELAARSAYILSGPARKVWEHHIPPVKNLRYSITLRTLKKD